MLLKKLRLKAKIILVPFCRTAVNRPASKIYGRVSHKKRIPKCTYLLKSKKLYTKEIDHVYWDGVFLQFEQEIWISFKISSLHVGGDVPYILESIKNNRCWKAQDFQQILRRISQYFMFGFKEVHHWCVFFGFKDTVLTWKPH